MPKEEYTKADYEKQVATNLATQKTIDGVVAYITGRDYEKYPTAAALFADAAEQLGFAGEMKEKAEQEAANGNFHSATLWAGQWWQYQVKAADLGLRAKTNLEQAGAGPAR
jgi:nitrous-oxide reductase